MPSFKAAVIAGSIDFASCASTINALAPPAIRLCTSFNCLVGSLCASALMYLAPAAVSAALIAASSVFQRSSWKFDQETPTTRSSAEAITEPKTVAASAIAGTAHRRCRFILKFLPSKVPARRFRPIGFQPVITSSIELNLRQAALDRQGEFLSTLVEVPSRERS